MVITERMVRVYNKSIHGRFGMSNKRERMNCEVVEATKQTRDGLVTWMRRRGGYLSTRQGYT